MNRRLFFKFPLTASITIFSLVFLGAILFSSPLLLFSAKNHGTFWDSFHTFWRTAAPARLTFLIVACLFSGVIRVWSRHPRLVSAYGAWLSTTPWRPGIDLPLGPIHLVWEDLLVIGPTTIFTAWADGIWYAWLPMASYFMGYSLVSLAVLRGNRAVWILFAWLFLWTTAPLCGQWIWLILLAVASLAQWTMHHSMSDFPWDLPDGLRNLKKQNLMSLAWPMNRLGPISPKKPMDYTMSWTAAIFVGWMVFVGLTLEAKDSQGDAKDFALDMWLICILIGLGRAFVYCVMYWPPITWRGRFRTGHWIVPGYDYVFITPISMCCTAILIPLILPFGAFISAALTITAVMGIGFSGGPSLRAWQLTGHHRLLVPPHRQASIGRHDR